jgi:Glycogen debranching enzyme
MLPSQSLPFLNTDNADINAAFRIALGDLVSNIQPFQDGLLTQAKPVVLAGLDYDTPWTRDAAINTWNGAGLLFPEIARNTLLSVLERQGDMIRIGGQYWDAIIWACGAWWYYLYTGDSAFLTTAFSAIQNSLSFFEEAEFDQELNLFRGPGCYGDGIAAYPDLYAQTNGASGILEWPAFHLQRLAPKGYGLPMHALSTNCLYYQAYILLTHIAKAVEYPVDPAWAQKAQCLKAAVNRYFWNEQTHTYRYLVDPSGNCDSQEGLGHSFVLLFGIADEAQAHALFQHQHVTSQGIPCLWPNFARYESSDGMSFGRHCGTIWPHIQAFWAHAAALHRQADLLHVELRTLAAHIHRDSQCSEIYHPITGEVYGGIQESGSESRHLWESCKRQTWSATGFLRIILMGLLGMTFLPEGISFQPVVPAGVGHIVLSNLPYREMILDIEIIGSGTQLAQVIMNGQEVSSAFSPSWQARTTIREIDCQRVDRPFFIIGRMTMWEMELAGVVLQEMRRNKMSVICLSWFQLRQQLQRVWRPVRPALS